MKVYALAAIVAALLLPIVARAQTVIVPGRLNGCGTVTATTTSSVINASTVTLCPNSIAFPGGLLSNPLKIKVQGNATNGVYVCKLGGTCTTAGELLLAGESVTSGIAYRDISVNPPSVLAVSGSQTLYLEW